MPNPYLNYATFHSGLWANSPLVERDFDSSIAVMLDEQFTSYDAAATTGDYVLTQATSGTAVISTTVPGALFIDSGATTAAQGPNIQRLKTAFVPAANKSLWAEWNIILTATTPPVTKAVLFTGLAESDTTIFAAGAQTTANHIGWRIATGGLLVTTFASAKATVELTRTGPALVAATAIKLGLYYSGADDTVQQYVNGVATGAVIPTANIPKVALYPSFPVLSDGTDRPNMIVQGYRVLQLR